MVCSRLLLFFVGSLAAAVTKDCSTPFVLLENNWCIFVNIAVPLTGTGKALTWVAARESCQHASGDLVVLEDQGKLQAISNHIDQTFQAETKTGWVYWVGAQAVGNKWQWVNLNDVDLQSNMWTPNQPSVVQEAIVQYGRLAPADITHGRRYLVSDKSNGISPAYICEKPMLPKK